MRHMQRKIVRVRGLNRSSALRALYNEGLKHTTAQTQVVSLLKQVPV
jgi:hypothetical protein